MGDKGKKILILTPFYPPNIGGAESFIEGLTSEAKKWFKITVLTFMPLKDLSRKAAAYQENYYSKGFLKIHRMRWLLKPSKVWQGTSLKNMFSVFPKMALLSYVRCAKDDYDIIHAQGMLSALVAILMKKIFKVKVYVTLLALYEFHKKNKLFRKVASYIFKNIDIIFVEGKAGFYDLSVLNIDLSKIKLFRHWCDQKIFKPKKKVADKIRVLFVGRAIRCKGKHIIEGAERQIKNGKFEFMYAEDVPFKDLVEYYQRADIVCVPSLYAEGFTRVIIEAASCGCAIIASNRGALPEMVQDFGIVCEPTIRDFAFNILRMEHRHKEYGLKAFLYSRVNYTSKNAEVFLNEY